MKFDAKSIMCVLCYILAIYGLIILIRKIMSRSEKNKEKSWSYYVEPYEYIDIDDSQVQEDLQDAII
jgi:hypothetical protein